MTKTEFMALCGKYLIDPGIALENENVRKGLKDRDREAVEMALENEF